MSLGLIKGEDISALINLSQTDTDVNILSTPSLLTNDNQEAQITVGERVPLITGTRYTEEDRPIYTFTYEDVGIILRIIPQINPKGFVTLKISQEITKVLRETLYEVKAPKLTKRETQTTVSVGDKETIVIGGLIRDDKSSTVRKVPFLGDIPLLGRLFRRETEETKKTSLLVFVTPHIITNPQEIAELTAQKKTESDKFIEKEMK
jgi:general secretion pathway protein D